MALDTPTHASKNLIENDSMNSHIYYHFNSK